MHNDTNILEAFLEEWPIDRLERMTLEEYTNLDKTSFCYWLESKTNDLGSIWGGSSYKFGIYRKQASKVDERGGYTSDDKYAWVKKYGSERELAFGAIKELIVSVARSANNADFKSIDKIDFGEAYKWKIAFLYSKESLLPFYKKEGLRYISHMMGLGSKLSIAEMQEQLMKEKPINESIYAFSTKLWDSYTDSTNDNSSNEDVDNRNTSYWLYAPGERGNMWDAFYNEGVMAIGWDFLGDISKYKSKKEIQSALQLHYITEGSKKNDTVTNDDFVNKLAVGDVVIVKGGKHKLLGFGVVSSDYIYDANRGQYKSLRKVDWKKQGQWNLEKSLALKTLTDISIYKSDNPNYEMFYEELMGAMEDQTITREQYPLNQILYGPPGTGKTYSTVKKALAIIEGVKEDDLGDDYDSLKKRYDHYCKEGQIVFTTFHQSMCYEDFLEGIKPQTDEDNNVIYNIEDGLFKRLSVEATFSIVENLNSSKAEGIIDFSLAYDNFTQMVEEKLYRGGRMPIKTKNGDIDIIGVSSQGNLILKHTDKDTEYTISKERSSRLNAAFPELDVITNIDREFREVIGGCNATASWAVLNAIRVKQDLWNKEDRQSVKLTYEEKKDAIASVSCENLSSGGKPYIIIIDEINRGNVSQIFGELITLLEENKRLGNAEQLEVILPYSKKKFGVPNNLHIIGTMNTADRSVEALDTALRRRFQFVEMAPNLEIIETVNKTREVEGIDLITLLKTINERIEILLDRDHLIGHSYFLNIATLEDLKVTFSKQIMPLLQEYFYGDYGKIALVLGEGFCHGKKIDNSAKVFAKVENYEIDSFDDQVIYTLVDSLKMHEVEFKAALETLLPTKGE